MERRLSSLQEMGYGGAAAPLYHQGLVCRFGTRRPPSYKSLPCAPRFSALWSPRPAPCGEEPYERKQYHENNL